MDLKHRLDPGWDLLLFYLYTEVPMCEYVSSVVWVATGPATATGIWEWLGSSVVYCVV